MTAQMQRRVFLRASLAFSASGGIAWTLTRGLRLLSARESVITPAIGITAEGTAQKRWAESGVQRARAESAGPVGVEMVRLCREKVQS